MLTARPIGADRPERREVASQSSRSSLMSLSAVDALVAALYMRAIAEGMEVCKGFKLRGLEEDEDEYEDKHG